MHSLAHIPYKSRTEPASVRPYQERPTTQLKVAQKSEDKASESKNNTGMPDQLKSGVENLSGISMDDVKVHYNSSKPAQLQAHAYAQGNQIHLAPSQERHLPHEAWHVVQQKQGRVNATRQLKGKVNINDDQSLEKEADSMGQLLSSGKNEVHQRKPKQLLSSTVNGNCIQRKGVKEQLLKAHVKFENFKEETEDIENQVDKVSRAIYNNYKIPTYQKQVQRTGLFGRPIFHFGQPVYDTQTHQDFDQAIDNKNARVKQNNVEDEALDNATRLNHWSGNALVASQRLFAELRGAVKVVNTNQVFGLQDIKFGKDTDTEADVVIHHNTAMESKQIGSASQAAVDGHITKGCQQLKKRTAQNDHVLYLEIINNENPWPFTPAKLQKMIDDNDQPSANYVKNTAKNRTEKYGKTNEKVKVEVNSSNPYVGELSFYIN